MTDDNWYGPEAATFGDRLAAARDAAEMTQNDLAHRLGVRVSTIRSWEEDRSEPRANRLSMIAGVLGVSMMWLLNGEGAGVPHPGEETEIGNAAASEELRALRRLLAEVGKRAERLEKMLVKG